MTVYLDNNATTRLDPRAFEAMRGPLTTDYGNPASLHTFGSRQAALIEDARAIVAHALGGEPDSLIFTSGGTESINAALRGALAAQPDRRRLVLTTVEHHAALEPAAELERCGVEVIRTPVDAHGLPRLEALEAAINAQTALVSVIVTNNETGVITPVREIAALAAAKGAAVHLDAVNAFGRLPLAVEADEGAAFSLDAAALGVDFVSVSAHKAHGPKGVGALLAQKGAAWRPLILGGPQERARRGGTSNTPGIAGFAAAVNTMRAEGAADRRRIRRLRDALERGLCERFPEMRVIGAAAPRVAHTLCVCFPGIDAEPMLILLSEAGVCASSGSACSSGSIEASHVLRAMGVAEDVAKGQLRFSFGRFNREEDVARVLEVMPDVVGKAAMISRGW